MLGGQVWNCELPSPFTIPDLTPSVFAQQPEKKADPSLKSEAVVTSLTLFAGTSEGLWRSPDWGASWKQGRGPAAGRHPGVSRGRARAHAPGPPGVGGRRRRDLLLGGLRPRLEAALHRRRRPLPHALPLSAIGPDRLPGDRFRPPALRRRGLDVPAHRPRGRRRVSARVAGSGAGRGHEPGRPHLRGRRARLPRPVAWACPTRRSRPSRCPRSLPWTRSCSRVAASASTVRRTPGARGRPRA